MAKLKQYALTTIDNPYNPFTDFRKWWLFDIEKGYNTCGYLARIAAYHPHMTDEQLFMADQEAIDEIIAIDPFNIYVRVEREVDEDSCWT